MAFELLFKLLVGHAVADFALQSTAMSRGKNRNIKPEYIPKGQTLTPTWFYWLTAHALIHGGCVYFITGVLYLGLFETFTHWIIDYVKCDNWLNPHTDQLLHLLSKVVIVLLMI